jgi:hypothetical protein
LSSIPEIGPNALHLIVQGRLAVGITTPLGEMAVLGGDRRFVGRYPVVDTLKARA